MKINLFRKIKLFLIYRKLLKKIKPQLLNNFNLRVDNSGRMYTVLNLPEDLLQEPYNLRTQDIDAIVVPVINSFIKEYTIELSAFLNSNGLNELYKFYTIEKQTKYSYLIVYGFSLFESNKFILNIYKILGFTLLASMLIFFLIKLFL